MMKSATTAFARLAIVALVAALVTTGAVAQEDAAPSQAHLIVHKSVVEDQLVIGKNMTIKIDVYNAGDSPALSVLVDDPMWDASQFDVFGATRATFAEIAPGARETLAFAVVPRSSGAFSAGPSLVTYKSSGSSSGEISGTSNALPRIPILSQLEEHLVLALKIGAVASFGFCKTADDWTRGASIFGGIAALLFLNQCLLTGRRAVRANRRRKAIAELTKDE
mmetsp:Transcript_14520/g.61183  ORF Transcript_14520/g.61183 Transcript_14520/m.61183 type:complete len:222 (-) Transcript_14520:88-753(-)